MNPLLQKLNAKGHASLVILNAPAPVMAQLTAGETPVIQTAMNADAVSFALAFVTQQSEIDEITPALAAKMPGDAVLWFAYPKSTSKRYQCDFNRDTGWNILGQHGWEIVRQVAIDEDWSALRFRRVEYIKQMTRHERMARSEVGKSRVQKKA